MPTRISAPGRGARQRRVLLFLGAAVCCCLGAGRAAADALLLPAGQTLKRSLAAGERHTFLIEPVLGQPARLIVEQRGIDVEIEVKSADGTDYWADGPFDRQGQEAVLLSGLARSRVTLRGREVGAPAGDYTVRLEPILAGTPDGDRRAQAALATTTAARLYRDGTATAWREALAHYQHALELWRALDDDREAARTLYAMGVLHRLVDAPKEALQAVREVLRLTDHDSDTTLKAYATNELGLDYWHLGDLDAARTAFARASLLGTARGDTFMVAAAASNLCLMDLSRGEIVAGHACYKRSLPTIEKARAAQIESAARVNLGRLAEHLGEPEEALEHYRRAHEIHTLGGDRRAQAKALNNLGVLLRGLGDLDAAMARYAEASEIFEALADRRWQARVVNNIGNAYRLLGEPHQARISFERARALFRQVADRRGEASTLDNLGMNQRELGNLTKALSFHQQALALRRQDGHRRAEAVTLRRLGRVYTELGQDEAARSHFDQALIIATELGDRPSESAARRGLGELHLQQGELQAARRQLEAALALATGAGLRTIEAEVHHLLARVARAAGQWRAARQQVAAALERLEDVRARIGSADLRTSYSGLLRRIYELDIDLLMAAHRADPTGGYDRRALEVAERARARTLLERLQEADIDLTTGVDPALVARRRSLTRRLVAKAERLAEPKLDPATRATLESEQLPLRQRLEVLDAEIRRHNPALGEIVRPRHLLATEIQALVDPDTTLAVYLLSEQRSYLWRVTTAAIDAFELPGRAVIEAAGRDAHARWSELDVATRATDYRAAAVLAEMLRLPALVGSRRLAIIADGALHLIPFAALPTPATATATAPATLAGGPPVPLVLRAEVVSLPSAAVLALDRHRHQNRHRDRHRDPAQARTVAILADPAFGPGHPSLPGSRLEAEAIAAVTAPDLVALGFDANRELVESGRLQDIDIVHFATHGVVDTENPILSGLLLSQVDPDGTPKRGFLSLHDIYNLRLDAELVVLSGCRTAIGPVVRGEGLVGLARGFMFAGSRRVVASLWPVEDRATAALMTRFYQALWQDGLPPAAALTAAQRGLARTRRFRDPYHWAGFVLVGDWR